jgi:hypothetical protein
MLPNNLRCKLHSAFLLAAFHIKLQENSLASTFSWQDILKCHKLSRFMYGAHSVSGIRSMTYTGW